MELRRKALAELIGSALLAATVVGSGIAAATLTKDVGLQLLINAVATGAVLVALILALGPVSAAFNPVVTIVERALGALTSRSAAILIGAQFVGCAIGVIVANLMFELPAIDISTHQRDTTGLWTGEVVATFGLVVVIFGCLRSGTAHVAYAVGGYLTAAYWFTSSTSFANPAITAARPLSDTFAGIAPSSVPMFVVMQLVGGAIALATVKVLYPDPRATVAALTRDLEPVS